MLTALQLAEQLEMLARQTKDAQLRGALHMAEEHLRGRERARMLSEDEVRLLFENTARGMEFCVYVEDRGYYKPLPAILDKAYKDAARVVYSNGMRYLLEMREYNRTWRLWDKHPSGVEMKKEEWRHRK